MKMPLALAASAFTLMVSFGPSVQAETLAKSWEVSFSQVQSEHPQARAAATGNQIALETGPLTYGGLHWDDAKFEFDQAGRLSKIRLINKHDAPSTIKAQLASDDSALWQAVDDGANELTPISVML